MMMSNLYKNMFGTDGIRAAVGTSPLTITEIHQLGNALGAWICNRYGQHASLLLGHDTRASCAWLKATLKSGLLAHPLHIYDAGELPTPAVVSLTRHEPALSCGIIISASHNGYRDNGIKLVTHANAKLGPEDEMTITNYFYQTPPIIYTDFGADIPFPEAAERYCARLATFFPADFLRGVTVVVDAAHGALHRIAPAMLQQFGATVYTIASTPNGININAQCGAVDPAALQDAVVSYKADIGFAFDGDGDRVIAVNCKGEVKDGDALLALLLEHPEYHAQTTVVGTVMSNQGLQHALHAQGRELIRVAVGDKHIAASLKERRLLLGAEQSGHVICMDYLDSGDGLFTALRILQLLKKNPTLATFAPMPQLLFNIPIQHKKDLSQEPFASTIKTCHARLGDGRVLVRYSGTEPLVRIMIEHADYQTAHAVGTHLARELEQLLR
jgi:phosphoglucosamine mutase